MTSSNSSITQNFTERVKAEFANVPNVKVIVHDEGMRIRVPIAHASYISIMIEWAAEKGMRTFLSVAAGTSEPAKFLEMCVFIFYAEIRHLIRFLQSLFWRSE